MEGFYKNHALLPAEREACDATFAHILDFMTYQWRQDGLENPLFSDEECDRIFAEVSGRISQPLPKDIEMIYRRILMYQPMFTGEERFLLPEELYVSQGVVIFYVKGKKPVAGYSCATGCLARYSRKEWNVELSDVCFYQFCLGRIITQLIELRHEKKVERCKGSLVTTLDLGKELEQRCTDGYELLDLGIHGIAVMYGPNGLLAWIRSNGTYGDIHVGAQSKQAIDDFVKHLYA